MSRPRRYETNADKQRAYRIRKAANKNFPVIGRDVERTERSGALAGDAPKSGVPFEVKKVGEFKMIVMPEDEVRADLTMPVVKPKIFRDGFGNVITEEQWQAWQEMMRKAEEKNYEIDGY